MRGNIRTSPELQAPLSKETPWASAVSASSLQNKPDPQWAVVHGTKLAALTEPYATLADLLTHGRQALTQAREAAPTIDLAEVEPLSPITTPAKLFCQGLNYASHREEVGVAREAKQNLIFGKDDSSLCGPNTDIIRPPECEMLDYEAELGLVFSRDITAAVTVTDDNLGDYIAGLLICDDVSARDLQFGAGFLQWFRGKGARTFCPTGPYLYLLDPGEATALYDSGSKTLGQRRTAPGRQHRTTDLPPTRNLDRPVPQFRPAHRRLPPHRHPRRRHNQRRPRVSRDPHHHPVQDGERQRAMVEHERDKGVRYLQKGDVIEITIRSPTAK